MRKLQQILVISLAVSSPGVGAASHLNDDQLHLEAIKKGLVEAARESSSTVVSTGWLDEKGALHESTVIESGAKIRGVRVRSYVEALQKGIDISIDSQEALLPECLRKDVAPKRIVGLNVSGFPQDGRNGSAFLQPLVNLARKLIHRAISENPDWIALNFGQNKGPYQNLVVDDGRRSVSLLVNMRIERVGLVGKAEALMKGDLVTPLKGLFSIVGKPREHPPENLLITISLGDSSQQDQIRSWKYRLVFPSRPVSFGNPSIPNSVVKDISVIVRSWMDQAKDEFSCEPVLFALQKTGSDTLMVSAGKLVGLEVGDRLLVMDREKIPGRVLEPGVLQKLAMVRVEMVMPHRSVVKVVAGSIPDDLTSKTAMLF